jgi:hypothetical protein
MKVARATKGGHARDPIKVPTTSLEYDFSVVIDKQVCITPAMVAPDSAPKADRIRNARLFAAAPQTYIAAKLNILWREWMATPILNDGNIKARLESLAESTGWKRTQPIGIFIDEYTERAVLLAEEGRPA